MPLGKPPRPTATVEPDPHSDIHHRHAAGWWIWLAFFQKLGRMLAGAMYSRPSPSGSRSASAAN